MTRITKMPITSLAGCRWMQLKFCRGSRFIRFFIFSLFIRYFVLSLCFKIQINLLLYTCSIFDYLLTGYLRTASCTLRKHPLASRGSVVRLLLVRYCNMDNCIFHSRIILRFPILDVLFDIVLYLGHFCSNTLKNILYI